MIQSMMLRQSKGRYGPKDLEGVLPVLDRCLYDGGDGGVVLCSDLRAEASIDLEFVKFGVGTVSLCIDRRPCEKFIKPLLHLRPYVRPDISLVPMVNGVSLKIHAVKDII